MLTDRGNNRNLKQRLVDKNIEKLDAEISEKLQNVKV